jgi:hypothetical protein
LQSGELEEDLLSQVKARAAVGVASSGPAEWALITVPRWRSGCPAQGLVVDEQAAHHGGYGVRAATRPVVIDDVI